MPTVGIGIFASLLHIQKLYGEVNKAAKYKIYKKPFVGEDARRIFCARVCTEEGFDKLGSCMGRRLSVDLVLQSLHNTFSHSIMSHNMNENGSLFPLVVQCD